MPLLTGGGTVSVEAPNQTVSVEKPAAATASVQVIRGPQGPPGTPGSGALGFQYDQVTPAATWTIPVPPSFGRIPMVVVYIDGELVITDVAADDTTVSIQFPIPTAGSAVLT